MLFILIGIRVGSPTGMEWIWERVVLPPGPFSCDLSLHHVVRLVGEKTDVDLVLTSTAPVRDGSMEVEKPEV
jgi:hypothetical protein